MRLIGLSGFKTAGKDATFDCIKATCLPDHVITRVALGNKVKELAGLGLGFGGSPQDVIDRLNEFKLHGRVQYEDFDNPRRGGELSVRSYLQDLGHAARELFGEDFWVDQVLPRPQFVQPWNRPDPKRIWDNKRLAERYPTVNTLVVTDIRYPNEAIRVRDLGGRIIEIVRPGVESDGKPSETPLPRGLVDVCIVNDAGIPELQKAVSKALKCV